MNSILVTLAALLVIALTSLVFADHLKIRAEIRRNKAKARERFLARPKGRIVKVGRIIHDEHGRELPWEFTIDCMGRIPDVQLMYDGENVRTLMAGWTAEELVEIARNPKEWETVEDR